MEEFKICHLGKGLTHSHTITPFDAPRKQAFSKHWEKEKLLVMSNFLFPTVFSTCLENFLLFSSNLKLSSADCFNLEELKICHLGKGLTKKSSYLSNNSNTSTNNSCFGLCSTHTSQSRSYKHLKNDIIYLNIRS